MVRATSIEVYKQITSEGLLSKKRLQVYSILYEDGGPLTGSQIARRFKTIHPSSEHSESIRNRITELVQQGVVTETGTGECPMTKRNVMLFQANDSLPKKIPKKDSLKKKKAQILKDIVWIGEKVKALDFSNAEELTALRNLHEKVSDL
tara:strand:+ start:1405 stop:1851 length:447 start_codon:yes stop_codon:yes gene_type:complete